MTISTNMKKIYKNIIILSEPYLRSYRVPIWNNLAKKNKLILLCDIPKKHNFKQAKLSKKIRFIKTRTIILFKVVYQFKLLSLIKKNHNNLKAITLSANNGSLSNYIAMIFCKKNKVPVYLWGHGLFKKNLNNYLILWINKILLHFQSKYITKYICYNNLVKKSLIKINFPRNKLTTINNTLEKEKNNFISLHLNKNKNVLFIGRLRKFNNLNVLFNALSILKAKKININLHCIGSGPDLIYLKNLAKELNINVLFYGGIHDDSKKRKIARSCIAAIYPGSAGLSVVDYFSYSLPVIIHNKIQSHMGPEPYYVKNNINGLHFEKNSYTSLANTIYKLYINRKLIKKLSINSFQTFLLLSKPKMSDQLNNLINRKK